jgi:hydrogenase/urease accessory protein HupE
VSSGLGPFYDGVSHLALTPEDLLLAVAMALLAGAGGAAAGRATLLVLPLAWLLGGVGGLASPSEATIPALRWVSLLVPGLLVAIGAPLPRAALLALAAGLGLLHGHANGAAMARSSAAALGLVGIVAALFVVVALVAALAVGARAGWSRIAVRVAGSWIAAIGLLALGWALRGGRG